jgi:hypothetical protein
MSSTQVYVCDLIIKCKDCGKEQLVSLESGEMVLDLDRCTCKDNDIFEQGYRIGYNEGLRDW